MMSETAKVLDVEAIEARFGHLVPVAALCRRVRELEAEQREALTECVRLWSNIANELRDDSRMSAGAAYQDASAEVLRWKAKRAALTRTPEAANG